MGENHTLPLTLSSKRLSSSLTVYRKRSFGARGASRLSVGRSVESSTGSRGGVSGAAAQATRPLASRAPCCSCAAHGGRSRLSRRVSAIRRSDVAHSVAVLGFFFQVRSTVWLGKTGWLVRFTSCEEGASRIERVLFIVLFFTFYSF